MQTEFDKPQQSPGFMLWRLSTEWQRNIRQALQEFNLKHVEFVYLACLQWLQVNSDATITQTKISLLAGLDKMVISETSKKLLAKKFIKKDKHRHDSRASIIALTNAGRKIIDQALPKVEAVDKEFFNNKKLAFTELLSLLDDV